MIGNSRRGAVDPTPSIIPSTSGFAALKPCKDYIPHSQYEDIVAAINNASNQIVNIYGLGGIGKSSLLSKYVNESSRVYYYDLSNAPHFSDVAYLILHNVFEDKEVPNTDNEYFLLEAVKNHLLSTKGKLIFIFDNLEAIMQTGAACGNIRKDYCGFDAFFQFFIQLNVGSSLILSGREKVELSTHIDEGIEFIKLLGLDGSQTEELLKDFNLTGNHDDLCKKYSGNPLALKMVASYILENNSGNIDAFLSSADLPDEVFKLFQEHFNRLDNIEKTVLLWLAVEREPFSLQQLMTRIVLVPTNTRNMSAALKSLEKRCLVEHVTVGERRWYLQGVILEFSSDFIKDAFIAEIQAGSSEYLTSLSLIDTSAKEYIIETQKRILVNRIIDELSRSIGESELKLKLHGISGGIDAIRSYAAGNLINLYAALDRDITDFDFKSKYIINADLRYVSMRNSDLSGAKFEGVLLKNTYGTLIDVRYSSDDKYIFGAATEFSVGVWDAESLHFESEISEHHDWVRSVDSNKRYIASGSNDEKVIVYDYNRKTRVSTSDAHSSRVRRVRFSPLSEDLLYSSDDDGKIIGWNIRTNEICTLCVASEETVRKTKAIWDFVFVNQGKQIVSVSDDKTVSLWETAIFSDNSMCTVLYTHDHSIKSITSNGSDTVFCGCDDGTILEININAKRVDKYRHFNSMIWCVDFCKRTKRLMSSYDNGNVIIWAYSCADESHLTLKQILPAHKSKVWSANFSFLGDRFVTSSDDFQFKVWNAETYLVLHTIWGYTNLLRTLAVSDEHDSIIVAGDDAVIRRYCLSDCAFIRNYSKHDNRVRHLDWSVEDGSFLSSSDDGTVMHWEDNKTEPTVYKGHTKRVWSVAHIGEGKFASVGEENDVYVWEKGNSTPARLTGHSNWIWDISYCSEKDIFATASEDSTCILWKYSTENDSYEKMHGPLHGHSKWLFAVAFSPNGDRLITCSADNTAIVYDTASGEFLHRLKHEGWVWSAVWIDEETVVTGSADSKIRVWRLNYETGESTLLKTMTEHTSWVVSLGYSTKHKMLFSASADQTTKMWDATTFQYKGDLHIDKPYDGLRINEIQGLTQAEIHSLIKLGAVTR